jgi:methylthioxylose transferase
MSAATASAPAGAHSLDGGSRRRMAHLLVPVLVWLVIVVVARVVGIAYVRARDTPLAVDAVPWVGRWSFDTSFLPEVLLASAAGAFLAWWWPAAAIRHSWRGVLGSVAVLSPALTFLLVRASPTWWRWRSIELGYGMHTTLVSADGPASYLATYVEHQPDLGGHLRAHPPGFVLLLWALEQIGLRGTGFHLALMLVSGAVASIAALVALRAVAGERAARAAAPFVALGPVLVWRTNADVVFGGIALAGVACAIVAACDRDRERPVLAACGGALFAGALMCTYGVVLLAVPIVVVAVRAGAWRSLAITAGASMLGLAAFQMWGFSWVAGLLETRVQYRNSLSHARGYAYWLLGNAATFAVLIGPATVAALGRVRGSVRVLVLAGLACPILAGLSGMSSAETERIWQPFVPLALLACASLWLVHDRFDMACARRWLALQVGVTLVFQAGLQSPW